MNAEHSLPPVPHLPPLHMLEEYSSTYSSTPVEHRMDGPNSISFSPTPSFAESFSTAYTSPSQADFENTTSHHPSLSPRPSMALRKSMSVDSIIPHNREVHSLSQHPTRSPPSSLPKGHGSRDTSLPQSEGLYNIYMGRHRGYSIGSTRDSNANDSYIVDSDIERSEPLTGSIDRYRHISLKGHDQLRPPIKGGELPLPSRTPILSSTSSINSMNSSSTSSSTLESAPRKYSLISLQSTPEQGSISLSTVSGRIRSGSLGMYGNSGKRMLLNTQFDVSGPAVTIVVIGVKGCGKSVIIRKGLRGHELSEPSLSLGRSSRGDSLNYSRRVGRIARGENTPSCPLHVFEVEVATDLSDSKDSWPDNLSTIDGVIICYDSSNEASFKPVESLLRGYRAMKVPIVVLACKSDLPHQIEPERALEVLQQYDVGLVEVAKAQEHGKEKMRRTFGWLMKAVFRDRRTNRSGFDANYRNPASPDVLISPAPWETSQDVTPTASSSILSADHAPVAQGMLALNNHPTIPPLHIHPSTFPNSPTRARSTGDLLFENEQAKIWARHGRSESIPAEKDVPKTSREPEISDPAHSTSGAPNQNREKDKELRPAQWATLDELLDKLLFLAVSGDDPAYITHFLLTYRRFASPRSVLLAMQKRMRQLDNPSGDPMFACFAQMRICHLLELWIRDYPYDFSVKGTAGALAALVKSIISKTYLLHYGSEFLPFLEMLPNLVDQDSAWAWKVDDIGSDDSNSLLEEEESPATDTDSPDVSPILIREKALASIPLGPSRERKPSLPLPSILTSGTTVSAGQIEVADTSEKQQIKDLVKLAQEVLTLDPDEIAQEITRVEVKLFLDIQPRHWLNYTFVSGKKDESDPITAFNSVSNHLADWVVSLILCHERPRARVKQIEKFVEIAHRLRALNNYSALRAFVAGINNATFVGDDTLEQFKLKCPEQAKALQSWDVLLQHIRSHRAYRLALKNTKGACIPALEVHMSDLIRAHEGNEDLHPSDPTKIHWGKFNMMGRFITSTAQCQAQCRIATEYNFIDRNAIKELFVKRPVMNNEMQKSRIGSQEIDNEEYRPSPHPIPTQPRDAAILRKLFFW
ncbi:ras guanine nucleotide exchange factor domain-containing protein [Collybia nuda]|uniref:Ras guanine nucleotide exchange factor domain-containing protein n=1 Tax=Collybia nuda TaxID=64659 RepID=A0A9P6CGG2_9AGAR|nr:ras guanine nucleotide exchange factor domain-containing protein [Collybia nuda]